MFLNFKNFKDFLKYHKRNNKQKKIDNIQELAKNLSADDIIIDCGANIGKVIIPLIEYGCKIYAFEPNKTNLIRIKEN